MVPLTVSAEVPAPPRWYSPEPFAGGTVHQADVETHKRITRLIGMFITIKPIALATDARSTLNPFRFSGPPRNIDSAATRRSTAAARRWGPLGNSAAPSPALCVGIVAPVGV